MHNSTPFTVWQTVLGFGLSLELPDLANLAWESLFITLLKQAL